MTPRWEGFRWTGTDAELWAVNRAEAVRYEAQQRAWTADAARARELADAILRAKGRC